MSIIPSFPPEQDELRPHVVKVQKTVEIEVKGCKNNKTIQRVNGRFAGELHQERSSAKIAHLSPILAIENGAARSKNIGIDARFTRTQLFHRVTIIDLSPLYHCEAAENRQRKTRGHNVYR